MAPAQAATVGMFSATASVSVTQPIASTTTPTQAPAHPAHPQLLTVCHVTAQPYPQLV